MKLNSSTSIFIRLAIFCFFFIPPAQIFPQNTENQEIKDLLTQAKLLDKEENFEASSKLYKKGLVLLKNSQNHVDILFCYNSLARIAGNQSHYAEEKDYIAAAFEYGKEYELLQDRIFSETYERRGEHFERTGFFEKSFRDFSSAQKLIQSKENPKAPVKNHQFEALGRVSALLGSQMQAGDYYEKSLEANRALYGENSLQVAKDYNVLGVNKEKTGDFAKAIEYQEASLRIYRALGKIQLSDAADSYNNLGNAHFYLGHFDEAEKNYRTSLQIYQKKLGKKSLKAAYATMNIGIIYAVQGEFDTALDYFEKERNIKLEIFGGPHPDLIYSYNNLGAAFQRMGDNEKALEMHFKSNEIAEAVYPEKHPVLAKTYEDISFIYQLKGEYEEALSYMQKNLVAGSRYFSSSDINQNPKTTDFLDPANRIRSLREKVKLLELKSRQENSQTSYLKTALNQSFDLISLLDFMRSSYKAEDSKKYWQKGSKDFYEKGINLAYELWDKEQENIYIDKAFELMSRNKSLFLLASVLANKGLKFAGISEELLVLEDSLKKELNFYEKLIDQNPDSLLLTDYQTVFFNRKESYDSLLGVFERKYPVYHALKYNTQATQIETLQQDLLAPGTYWLEYFVGDTSMFALLIGRDTKKLIKLSSPENLATEIDSLRKNLYSYFLSNDPNDSLFKTTKEGYISLAHELHSQLIHPVFGSLAETPESLIIVPDRTLGYLPFDLLLTQKAEVADDFASLPYLIKTTSISYSYSATLLEEMQSSRKQRSFNKEVLVVAPEFASNEGNFQDIESLRREGLGALVYNQKEASSIQSIMGGKMLRGDEATQANFLSNAKNYSLIHFATHGKVNTQNADYSYLALAPKDTGSHELLYVNDLYSMNIPAEMVVLSACETGLGSFTEGEGIASLSRAFSYAGAQSIVTTLWSVNDQKTAELMEQFYLNIAEGMSKDQALRKAKLDFLEKQDAFYSHPFFWGATIPVGFMAPIDSGTNWTLILIVLGLILILAGIYLKTQQKKQ